MSPDRRTKSSGLAPIRTGAPASGPSGTLKTYRPGRFSNSRASTLSGARGGSALITRAFSSTTCCPNAFTICPIGPCADHRPRTPTMISRSMARLTATLIRLGVVRKPSCTRRRPSSIGPSSLFLTSERRSSTTNSISAASSGTGSAISRIPQPVSGYRGCHPSLRKDRSGGHFPIRKDFSRVVASRRTAGKKYLPGAGRAFVMLDEDRGSRTIPGGSGGMESSANDGPNPDQTWIFWQYLPICSNVPTLQSGDRT